MSICVFVANFFFQLEEKKKRSKTHTTTTYRFFLSCLVVLYRTQIRKSLRQPNNNIHKQAHIKNKIKN